MLAGSDGPEWKGRGTRGRLCKREPDLLVTAAVWGRRADPEMPAAAGMESGVALSVAPLKTVLFWSAIELKPPSHMLRVL